ncbi:MAG: ferrous iron transport protein B, partial [Deltaproteobacteria bacterium]|nr:ferrous iron transport protein B [Deltaproteobacteria bacterium]
MKITCNIPKVALIGNPNVGKSVIFSFLTGRHTAVSNYPGTTVEVARGSFNSGGREAMLIDTPGVNSLTPMSEDEEVTRNILINEKNEKIDGVIQVADAKNLRRGLLVSLQLAEMEIPFLLDLNMEDESAALGIGIDKKKLSELLGVEVVGTVAVQKKGLKDLQKPIAPRRRQGPSNNAWRAQRRPDDPDGTPSRQGKYPIYSADIESAIGEIAPLLPPATISRRSMALMLLSGDISLMERLAEKLPPNKVTAIEQARIALSRLHPAGLAYLINKQRLRAVDKLIKKVVVKEKKESRGWAQSFGRLSMHPLWGLFILAGVLFGFYEFVGKFGAQTLVDLMENTLFGNYLNPWATRFFTGLFSFSPFLTDLFVGPYGVITMALTYALAIILPIVTTFFIAFSLIEDSGYLPRLAIMLNKGFRLLGLNGKAVIPMVLGLGCDTMATMTARIMETRKEKIIVTLLLALGVPCSAQLGIILGLLGALPPWATFVWLGVVIGSILLVGFFSAQILTGPPAHFILEIPPIRRPKLGNILTKTLARLEWYLKEVVPLFVLGTLVLFFLDKFSLLPAIQSFASPLVEKVLHLPPSATEAFLIGFLRRDYGATRFFDLFQQGGIDAVQTTV